MPGGFRGAIFDVDGVLVGSPHEQASREAPSSASAAGNAPGTPDDPGDGEQADPGASSTNQRQRIDAGLAAAVAHVPGVQAVAPGVEGYAQLVGRNGKPIAVAANGAPTLGVAWTDVAALNPPRMPSRRAARLDVLHAVTTE